MLKRFALHDANLNDRQVGVFTYDSDSKQFTITVDRNIPIEDLPLSLELLVHKGNYSISHDDSIRWVRSRICPPGRHNIREILSEVGLPEYDEFGLIHATKAKCGNDDLYIMELHNNE